MNPGKDFTNPSFAKSRNHSHSQVKIHLYDLYDRGMTFIKVRKDEHPTIFKSVYFLLTISLILFSALTMLIKCPSLWRFVEPAKN